MKHIDLIIVGAGQAGLATGYYLKDSDVSFLILEKHQRVGDNWRQRYDSLVLFASRQYSTIPGLDLEGDQEGYPGKDELADYLEKYVSYFDLPVQTNTSVLEAVPVDDGYQVTLSNGETLHCFGIVCATGGFQVPAVPQAAQQLAPSVQQFTPDNYQRPSQVTSDTLVIVGDGATGRQVAREMIKTHKVVLATGQERVIRPQRFLGKDYFWWIDKLGFLGKSKESWLGRYMMKNPPFPGTNLKTNELMDMGITIKPRLTSAEGNEFTFEDGSKVNSDAVLWSIGYRCNFDWLKVDGATDDKGDLIEHRGVCPTPGLYTIGKAWQWTRGSATLTGVGNDARHIVQSIKEDVENRKKSQIQTRKTTQSAVSTKAA